jgi:hypothetical protein
MNWFGRILLTGWAVFVIFIAAEFTFPKTMSHEVGWLAPTLLPLMLMLLLLSSAVFAVVFVYRLGMNRNP